VARSSSHQPGAALTTPRAAAPLLPDEKGSRFRWAPLLFLGAALLLLLVAVAPAGALRQPVADAVASRRLDLAFVAIAVALGVGLTVLLTSGAS
jgi:hypothetical protein